MSNPLDYLKFLLSKTTGKKDMGATQAWMPNKTTKVPQPMNRLGPGDKLTNYGNGNYYVTVKQQQGFKEWLKDCDSSIG